MTDLQPGLVYFLNADGTAWECAGRPSINVGAPEYITFSDFTTHYNGLDYFNKNTSIIGDGIDRTIYSMVPYSSTRGPYVAALQKGDTNQCTLIRAGGEDGSHIETGLEYANFTLNGTDQGHIYNGLTVGYSDGAHIHDVKITNVPGDDVTPPGETFLMSLWHANNALIENVILDGGGVAATISGNNNIVGATFKNCQFLNSGCAMPLASWQSKDLTFIDCKFLNANRGINIENAYGGFHHFKNCEWSHYTYDFQLDMAVGVWVAPNANVASTVTTVEDPVWDFDVDGPFVVRTFPVDRYPNCRQKNSDIHLVLNGVDVSDDPTKLKLITP